MEPPPEEQTILTDRNPSCSICNEIPYSPEETRYRGIKRSDTPTGSGQGKRRSKVRSRLLPFALVSLALATFFAAFTALAPESGLTTRLEEVSGMHVKLPQSLDVLLVL